MSLSMGNLPKSHSEGPRRPTADGEPCLRCHLARSTTGRDDLTGTKVKSGAPSPGSRLSVPHVLRRHFFVRDMVEEHEIIVPFVRTHDMN